MKNIVLIADIESSRKVADRNELQEKLKAILDALNHGQADLISPYTLTLGDEFQAVFHSAEGIYADAVEILAALYPLKARFSIGIGEITTDINPTSALGMDGPAFYLARDGIHFLKETDGLFLVSGLDTSLSGLVNSGLSLIASDLRKWKLNRFQTLRWMNRGKTIREIAEAVHVTDKAIYKTISDGNLNTIQVYFKEVEKIINENLQ